MREAGLGEAGAEVAEVDVRFVLEDEDFVISVIAFGCGGDRVEDDVTLRDALTVGGVKEGGGFAIGEPWVGRRGGEPLRRAARAGDAEARFCLEGRWSGVG